MRAALLAGLLLGSSTAWAQTPGTTAVVAAGSCSAPSQGAQARALREALTRKLGGAVQNEAASAKSLGGLSSASQAELDRRLAAARTDFLQQKYARVQKDVQDIREALWQLAPSDARWKSLQDAAALSAWIAEKLGSSADAEAALLPVVRIDPGFHPDKHLFPPNVDKLARQAAARAKGEPEGSLRVTSVPDGLPIWLDGKPVGKAPLSLQLARGDHRIEATFNGHRGLAHTVHVEESAVVELDQALDGAVWADAGPCIDADADRNTRLKTLVSVGHVLGVKTLVAVRGDEPAPSERYLVATAIDVESGQEAREAKVKLSEAGASPEAMDKLAAFIATGDVAPPLEATRGGKAATLASAAPPTATAPAGGLTQTAPESGSGMRTGAYVAGGVAVAALAVGGFFALDLKSANTTIDRDCPGGSFCSPGTLSEVQDATSRQGRDRALAFTGLGVGVAAGAAAVALFMMGEPATAPTTSTSASVHLTPTGLAGTF
ncbi:MAG: PEGA domain-containing protein [Deltaproteobacteria bacterium]|nr:PEGA domain-containing protein [Deltaproteobacteria bacterium]